MTRQRWGYAVLLGLALVLPFFVEDAVLWMKVMCFALFASAFNLLLGYAGLLSFGHAAFLGSAGYITGHLVKELGMPPAVGILAGTGFAALLGFAFGALAIRRQGIYFAMITLALSQLVYFAAVQLPFTHGEDGIQGIPRGTLFGVVDLNSRFGMYYTVLGIFLLGFLLIHRTIHSPFGQVLRAIKENEPRAISLGYDVNRYKLLAFVLSAALSGLAGSTKALVFQLESLTDVQWHMSGEVVLMTLLGGMGTVLGPLTGSFLVVMIEDYFAGLGEWVPVIMGCIFVFCVLVFRRGIVGEAAALWKRTLPDA
ncbi:MAG: branched-chain amino acid ABC transporter permease [Hyalangium sp.]|uniref:branched-chain amino acid ABC transporter permease n=1 Tax=Hyalangium sp. TaxID=2028555 RepID=UPI00389AD6F3